MGSLTSGRCARAPPSSRSPPWLGRCRGKGGPDGNQERLKTMGVDGYRRRRGRFVRPSLATGWNVWRKEWGRVGRRGESMYSWGAQVVRGRVWGMLHHGFGAMVGHAPMLPLLSCTIAPPLHHCSTQESIRGEGEATLQCTRDTAQAYALRPKQ